MADGVTWNPLNEFEMQICTFTPLWSKRPSQIQESEFQNHFHFHHLSQTVNCKKNPKWHSFSSPKSYLETFTKCWSILLYLSEVIIMTSLIFIRMINLISIIISIVVIMIEMTNLTEECCITALFFLPLCSRPAPYPSPANFFNIS